MPDTWPERLQWAAWGLLAALLPVTSLPLLKPITRSGMVAPASVALLLPVVALWLAPALLRGARLNRAALPLLAFVSAALFSAGLAVFGGPPAWRSFNPLNSSLSALLTLGIGVSFFIATAAWARDDRRLRFLLRVINWSGLAIILWALAQAAFWRLTRTYPGWMEALQSFLSTSGLFPGRATGFAFEPSWLAHQLNLLYLPWWLASALRGSTVHRLRVGFITFERLLLAGGVLALVLSVSRIGWLGFLLPVAWLILLANLALLHALDAWIVRRAGARPGLRLRRVLAGAALVLVLLGVYIGLFLGAGVALSRFDPRMKEMFNFSAMAGGSFIRYANQLVFAERLIFWQAGWNVFDLHPVFGAGPGLAGFYFPETLSPFAWGLTEVRTLMYQWDAVPNSKSLWVRILAETGLVGAAFFAAWLAGLGRAAAALRRERGWRGALGLAGGLTLVALIVEGFSVDTFALPYFWVSFGLVAAALRAPLRPQDPPLSYGVGGTDEP